MSELLKNTQIDVDIVRLDSDAIYEHLRNSTAVLTDILSSNREEETLPERVCLKCSKIFKCAPMKFYPNNPANQFAGICGSCDKTYPSLLYSAEVVSSDKLQNGAYNVREKTDTGHACIKCGKIYKTTSTLRAHCLFKHPENDVIGHCHACDKTYSSLLSLRKHIRYMHRYDHRCKVCYKTFVSEDLLIAHGNLCIKVETPCIVCNKIFHSDLALRNHIKYKHPKNENHRCDYCRRVFTTNRKLNNHIATIHPPGKTTCAFCDRIFNSFNALQSHILYRHSNGRAKCEFCHKVFGKTVFLRKHISKRHS